MALDNSVSSLFWGNPYADRLADLRNRSIPVSAGRFIWGPVAGYGSLVLLFSWLEA